MSLRSSITCECELRYRGLVGVRTDSVDLASLWCQNSNEIYLFGLHIDR